MISNKRVPGARKLTPEPISRPPPAAFHPSCPAKASDRAETWTEGHHALCEMHATPPQPSPNGEGADAPSHIVPLWDLGRGRGLGLFVRRRLITGPKRGPQFSIRSVGYRPIFSPGHPRGISPRARKHDPLRQRLKKQFRFMLIEHVGHKLCVVHNWPTLKDWQRSIGVLDKRFHPSAQQ